MSYVPAPQLARRPIGAVSTTNTVLWVALALGIGWVVFSNDLHKLWRASPKSKPSGWYVQLYSEPKGSRGRRVKMVAGPFDTKDEATERADAERDVWYPEVRYSQSGFHAWEEK